MPVMALLDQDFESKVLKEKGFVLVDFWAEWCQPCLRMAPVLDEISQELKDQIKIFKINVDENQRVAMKYSVRSLPTFLLFKEGEMIRQTSGQQKKEDFLSFLSIK